ncbi:hypothetical protein [Butyrivibrio sp. AD3002]|uniref:hypothetical protein n=1 Tax=Butyrivibrio sp. AD3002 TaxID=1280670 RepID=UPI0005D185DB|nr:hypothetical protein [Butyrivibrio sp. AD3002]
MKRNETEQRLWDLYVKYKNDGFSSLAFTLHFFIEKLYKRLVDNCIQDVFFLSREGQFLKELFEEYQNRNNVTSKVNSHYLIVSRRSTTMPALKKLEEEDFDIILRQYFNISLYDFLSSIGFEESEIREIGKDIDFDIYTRLEDFKHQYIYRKLRKSNLFRKLYEEKRKEQKSNFTKYLDSFGVDYSNGLCIVDVGWKGTIQDNIFEFLGEEIKVTGFYLGINGHGIIDPLNYKKGILFYTDWNKFTPYFFVFSDSTAIYEVMLGASHGSAHSYEDDNGKAVPVTKEQEKELELYHSIIKPEQEKMMVLFKKIDDICRVSNLDVSEALWADIHAHLIFKPSKEQITIFNRMYHYENFGVFEYTTFDGNEITMGKRLSALKKLARRPGAFLKSGYWTPVTLYANGLGCLNKLYGAIVYRKFYEKKPMQLIQEGICEE